MRDEFILIYSRSGSWGTRCLSPATVRPFAASGPRVWGHSRFSPAAFEKRPAGVSPLRGEVRPQKRFCPLQTCSPHSKPSQPPLGAWRAGRVHPHLFSVWQLGDALSFPLYSPSFRRQRAACVGTQSILPCSVRTLCWPPVSPALHTPSTRTRTPRALLRGGGCRCSRFGPATHFSLGNIPPASTGSTDGSKQRLQGFCSTAVAFLLPTERSDRGNTAVGHRTRVLQPKGDGGLRPILDLRRLNFPSTKGKFKMLMIKTIMSQVQEGDWFVTIDLKDAYFTSRSFKDTGGSFGLPLEGRLTNTRSRPSAWLGAENVYEMHGCCTGPLKAPGHSCTELSGRLAHSGSLQGASESS